MQTLCAIDHLDYKKPGTHVYEQLFIASQDARLRLGHDADVEIFRRMVFNVMARNCDDHTKNVSFLLRRGGAWELAPAYDLTFCYNPDSVWVRQHQMSVSGKFIGISRADCMRLADRFGVGEAKTVIEEVRAAVGRWQQFASEAQVPEDEARRISKLHELSAFS
jgi:serine/threonine-protein kinase HipA